MKGLKKVALASAIAAISAGAQAELKALDDSMMGELTGQAGLTIDVETKWTIGEFAYHDAGYVVLQGLAMGGNTNDAMNTGYLDNFRMTIDVAGATPEAFNFGFSEVNGLAAIHAAAGNSDPGILAAAYYVGSSGAVASTDIGTTQGLNIDGYKTYGDGDLVIHFGFTDAWEKGGGFEAYRSQSAGNDGSGNMNASLSDLSYSAARDIASRAVDFQFDIDLLGIAASTYTVGSAAVEKTDHATGLDATADTTALISDISFKGYLGPADLHISNNGNGFGAGAGRGDADSKITWGSFFKVTDLDLYIDIAGVQLSDIKIHNERGDQSSIHGTSAFGFAHSIREIYAVKDAVLNLHTLSVQTGNNPSGYVDGIALNTEFKGDIDIMHLSFGDTGTSIGEIYLTDVYSDTNWTISAH